MIGVVWGKLAISLSKHVVSFYECTHSKYWNVTKSALLQILELSETSEGDKNQRRKTVLNIHKSKQYPSWRNRGQDHPYRLVMKVG